ncbi:MAG: DUF1592 domain-containing protein [Gemmatimonadetes bacterium]|nr:DUF1592 domain-containing protein [Gemmatimonadota bacterium]
MKTLAALATTVGLISAFRAIGPAADAAPAVLTNEGVHAVPARVHRASPIPAAELNDVIRRSCQRCHSDRVRRGNLSLEHFDVSAPTKSPEMAENVIAKLRTGMMPPPGQARPSADTLAAIIETLENQLDADARANPNPGARTFQRLNRAEYSAAVRDLIGLEIDAADWLPLDTKSENFDNIADAQLLSPTLLDAYLRAASDISWRAVGNPQVTPSAATFTVPRTASQTDHVEGAPIGTRGGVSVVHTFAADGEYVFRLFFYHETTGAFAGGNARSEQVELSVDGSRVAVLDMDRWMTASDPNGVSMATEPVRITAGPHRVSAAFIPPVSQDVLQDLISPLAWSLASTSNATAYGFSSVPHLRDLVIAGPTNPTGVSDNPTRRRIFTCRPPAGASADVSRQCARSIVTRLAASAYRRPISDREVDPLMELYDIGAATGGFEAGVRTALTATLASPDFVFRFERPTAPETEGENVRVGGTDLASRLAFFIWAAPPDHELVTLGSQGKLADRSVLNGQVARMLADPRAATLATRFASQWLRLADLDAVQPDVRQYPNFDEQLRSAMHRETELLVEYIVREDRSVLELFNADYTFVNERLAAHYGIAGVAGNQFRRVPQTDPNRRGLLAHASVLTLTSQATRTSAVERGKWVMEVLLNSPPPPPPPGVPDLEATADSRDGQLLTVRERMEEHRRSPACQSCHKMMDPIGLALEHYDVTGRWRVRDNGMPIDPRGELWDGTPVASPTDLRRALLEHKETLLRTFTQNLMAYGLGRRVEYFDMPAVRTIVRTAEKQNHRLSSYVLGVVNSAAFTMRRNEAAAEPER